MKQTAVGPDLIEQARGAFPGLSPSEQKLLVCVQTGEIAYCGPSDADQDPANQPSKAETWGPDRSIRAAFVAWLCNYKNELIHARGIQVHGARFTGTLNLEFSDTSLHLAFLNSWFAEPILMRAIAAREISFAGCRLKSLDLRRAVLRSSLLLNFGASVEGMVILDRAQIGQDLDCDGSSFAGRSKDGKGFEDFGLDAPGIIVGSNISLAKGFVSLAGVNLANARVGGDFVADAGSFTSVFAQTGKGNRHSLDLNSIQVRRDIRLGSGLRSHGELVLDNVVCGGDIDLSDGCTLRAVANDPAFSAINAQVGGDVTLDEQVNVAGLFNLAGAHISGNLEIDGATLSPLKGNTDGLIGENAVVGGDLFLRNLHFFASVSLDGCSIGGDLDCSGARIHSAQSDPGKDTPLSVQRATVKGSALFSGGFGCIGTVDFSSTHIGADFNLADARLDAGAGPNSKDCVAFIANDMTVGGSFLARRITALGLFSIFNLSANGNFEADGSSFINPYHPHVNAAGLALKVGRVAVKGHFRINDCVIRGETNFSNAMIGADLVCSSTSFCQAPADLDPLTGSALNLDSAQVMGAVFLDGPANRTPMRANGPIILDYLQCSGDVFFDGAICSNPLDPNLVTSGIAIRIFSVKLARGLYFRRGFRAQGEVYVANSVIGEVLSCRGGSFSSPIAARGDWQFKALSIRSSRFSTIMLDGGCVIDGVTDLTDSTTNEYSDDWHMWPRKGSIMLEGFTYKSFLNSPKDAESRIAWLRLQPSSPFPSGSYRQLAKFLAETGDDTGSQMVLVALEDDRTRQPTYPKLKGYAKRALIGRTVGYGEEPLNAIWALAGLTAVGWIIYRRSYISGHMVPTDKDARAAMRASGDPSSEYDSFSPLIYSLENSLPLVKLGQADKWRPASHMTESATLSDQPADPTPKQNAWTRLKRALGFRPLDRLAAPPWVRYFLWFQILLGWALATLFVAGFSGLIKGK